MRAEPTMLVERDGLDVGGQHVQVHCPDVSIVDRRQVRQKVVQQKRRDAILAIVFDDTERKDVADLRATPEGGRQDVAVFFG